LPRTTNLALDGVTEAYYYVILFEILLLAILQQVHPDRWLRAFSLSNLTVEQPIIELHGAWALVIQHLFYLYKQLSMLNNAIMRRLSNRLDKMV
jgi:hypothetical protein